MEMKFTKTAAVIIAGALLLAGCGANNGAENTENTETSVTSAPAVNADNVVMTVGSESVGSGIFTLFFNSYNGQLKDAPRAKDMALEEAEMGFKRIAVAKAMGIELDDEAKKGMEDDKNQIKESYGDKYEPFLEENGLTETDIDAIVSMGYYTSALKDKVESGELTDDQKRDYFKNHYLRAKHVLISIDDDTDDAAAKAKAEEVLAKAQAGEDFDALIKEYGEDPGMEGSPDGYVFTDGTMVQEFEDGTKSIQPGEFTLVKTSYGYHVIQRLDLEESPDYFEEAYADVKDDIDSVAENGLFEEQLEKWVTEYNITVTKNDAVIDAIVAAAEADASAAPAE